MEKETSTILRELLELKKAALKSECYDILADMMRDGKDYKDLYCRTKARLDVLNCALTYLEGGELDLLYKCLANLL